MSRAKPRFRRNNLRLPVPANNVFRLKVIGSLENQLTVNTFFYRDESPSGSATETTLVALANAFAGVAGMLSLYGAAVSNDWSSTSLVIDSPNNPQLFTFTRSLAGSGTGPIGHEPTEVAAVILRQTLFKGQCGRGHISLPAVPTSWVTASRITTTTDYDALATAMSSTITNSGMTFHPGIFSRNGSNFQSGQQGYADVTGCVLNKLLGTVRRRKIGRGK